MVPTAIKHIYQTPHNHQTVSKGVREKQCLLPWNTSTKQSANSQQGTVDKQSAGTVSKQASKCDYPAYVIATIQLVARYNYVQLTTDYTAATNATICHYHRRHSFPPPPLCAVAADTAAEPDRARHCGHSLLLLVLLLPLNRRTYCCCHRRRERACVCVCGGVSV